MEEAELVKERLQAITDKRRIQQAITSKRLEIDREKLKLQHFKKKSLRDLWLMSGPNSGGDQDDQKAQDDEQQTKKLQSNIHRIKKEIEALEREELNISMSEELILKRLKSIEKSTEDIIKAANDQFKSESIQIYPGTQDPAKLYWPSNTREQRCVDLENKTDQPKPAPALFAMEINVQKDLRTGENHVLSTCTVPAQELQQHGIKVYDDGHKSVYALHSGQTPTREMDELSHKEVEDLLKQATEKNKSQGKNEAPINCERNQGTVVNSMDVNKWSELEYAEGHVNCPEQEIQEPAHVFHEYSDTQRYYHANYRAKHAGYETYQQDISCEPGLFYENHRETQTVHPDFHANHRTSSSSCHSKDPKPCVLNALPSDKPITMIFMGYQRAEEDTHSYNGSIQAELVVIEDGEEEPLTKTQQTHFGPEQKSNTNQASMQLISETGPTGIRKTKKGKLKKCCMLM